MRHPGAIVWKSNRKEPALICDIIVRAAQFEVIVVATRELLFHNEIFQPGQQFTLNEQANFLLLDCDVHSFQAATEWVMVNTQRLQAKVGDMMRPTLSDMGWQTNWVNARSEDSWEIYLQARDGTARGDASLIQLSRN